MKWTRTVDLWVIGFLVVALAALAIASVGTFEFFDYILPWGLALAATVVLAAGIPLLKFAATFDARRGRSYLVTMIAFLGVELVAQYFKAQASFAPTVADTATLAGSDLALAAGNDYASRLLAFVFLASLPLVVVVMSHAAAERLVRRDTTPVRLRAVVARFRARLASARQNVAILRQELAAERQAVAYLEQELATRPAAATVDVIYVARYRLTWQQLEQAVRQLATEDGVSLTTIRRRVADVGSPVHQIEGE